MDWGALLVTVTAIVIALTLFVGAVAATIILWHNYAGWRDEE